MTDSISVPRWYALQVRPKHEDMVAVLLRHKGYEVYLPTYRVAAKKKAAKECWRKLFPGYVFCRFAYGASRCARACGLVVSTPGVIRVAGGRQAIPDDEISAIQCALGSGLACEPWVYIRPGQKVEIDRGPLRGASGIVLSVNDGNYLVLSIELLHRSMAVAVYPEWVTVPKILANAPEAVNSCRFCAAT